MTFIDSNVFIRVLMDDNPQMAKTAREFFAEANQGGDYLVEDSVVAEILHVTTSPKLYNQSRLRVVSRLIPMLEIPNIYMHYKTALINALEKFASSSLDFVDCLALCYKDSGVVDKIFSFDKKLSKINS